MKPQIQRFPPTTQGFALVVTLALMILLTVIAVGLLSLSAISLRNSSQGRAQAEAQANARLALMIAIGELQKEMGPDMRVSAEAAIFDTDKTTEKIEGVHQPHWLASYNSWGGWLNGSCSPPDPAKTKYLILAEAKIPESVREALVILDPLPKPEGDLLFRAKVQDLAKFKGGDRLYINLSDSNIRVRLGKTTVPVAPGQANIYECPKLAAPQNMPIMYEFYHPERKEWKMLTASTVVLRPTRREICVFNTGTRPGNIRNHKILFPVK